MGVKLILFCEIALFLCGRLTLKVTTQRVLAQRVQG